MASIKRFLIYVYPAHDLDDQSSNGANRHILLVNGHAVYSLATDASMIREGA